MPEIRGTVFILERRGHRAVVPSCMSQPQRRHPNWRPCVEAARDAVRTLSDSVVLVGHSGGGLLLPTIAAAAATPVCGLIFVDSAVPASTGDGWQQQSA